MSSNDPEKNPGHASSASQAHSNGAGRSGLRAGFASLGASGSIVAGAVVAFLALTAFLSFEGLIPGDSQVADDSVVIAAAPGAPEVSVQELDSAPAAVSDAPIPEPVAAAAPGAAVAVPAPTPVTIAPPPTPSVPSSPGVGDSGGPPSTQPPDTSGPVGGLLGEIDDVLPSPTPSLAEATQPLTQPLDDTLSKLLQGEGLSLSDVQYLLEGTLAGLTPTLANVKEALLGEGPLLGNGRLLGEGNLVSSLLGESR